MASRLVTPLYWPKVENSLCTTAAANSGVYVNPGGAGRLPAGFGTRDQHVRGAGP